jgi:hypothetical protein
MDDAARNATEVVCSQCGAPADAGRIFCANCGTALQSPAPLIRPGIHDVNGPAMSPTKRLVVTAMKYLAGLSAVVFWLCPLRTGTQVLIFVASIVVLLICHSVLTNMDEAYAAKNAGYWPKLLDWGAAPKSDNPTEKLTSPDSKT